MTEYKKIVIEVGNRDTLVIKGDFKARTYHCLEETAYFGFDKHTALAVAEQLYKYYQSKNKEDDEIIRDTLKETATPMFAVIDKDHTIQKQVNEIKEMLEREKDQIPLLYCRTIFAESEDKIIQLALKCLKAYALKQLVTRESEQ